jgi:Ca2+-binding RTX toxin-like protein
MVRTTLSAYTLGADVENLTFIGTGDFSGTGNGLDNVIRGRTGNDVLEGLVGNDFLIGGLGNDLLVFSTSGFGNDAVQGFDANPVGGQDLLDISGLGITAATFAANVSISDAGADTLVQIGAESMLLLGIDNAATVTASDFLLAA